MKETTMKNQRNLIWLLIIAALSISIFFIIGCKKQGLLSPIPPDFLHVEGKKVIDENGNEIFLRGFNTGGFKFVSYKDLSKTNTLEEIDNFNDQNYKHYMTEDDIRDMKSMGANVLRAHSYFKFWTLETELYKYDDGFIKTMDDFIDMAYRNGVYVIIVLTNAAESTGEIKAGKLNRELYGGDILWSDEDFQQRVISAWGYLAKHYADNPGVAGYDIINEPCPPTKEIFHSFYSQIINEIRKVDRNHIIILSGSMGPDAEILLWGGEYEDNNIMLQVHVYADASKRGYYDPSQYHSRKELEEKLKLLLSYDEVKNRPIFVGEFSALWDSGDKGLQWTRDVINLMNQHGIHWTYFPYKNVYVTKRGLYVAKDWWLRGTTKQQRKNLEITKQLRERLLTSNFDTFPKLRQIIEDGFRNKGHPETQQTQ